MIPETPNYTGGWILYLQVCKLVAGCVLTRYVLILSLIDANQNPINYNTSLFNLVSTLS